MKIIIMTKFKKEYEFLVEQEKETIITIITPSKEGYPLRYNKETKCIECYNGKIWDIYIASKVITDIHFINNKNQKENTKMSTNNYTREVLNLLKADELAKICKENGIKYYSGKIRLKREEMIKKILGETEEQEKELEVIAEEEKKENEAIKEHKNTFPERKKQMSIILNADLKQNEGTKKYLETIKVGMLVAFKENNGYLNTAMVKNISFTRRKLKLITKYGKEFIVSFDDVMWVRTTPYWANYIMDILKRQKGESRHGAAK